MQAELRNGIITGYTITYQSQTENDNGIVTADPDDRQANLTELKEFVDYNISVVAFTAKGDGPPFVFIVRTDQDSKSYNTFIIIIIIIIISISISISVSISISISIIISISNSIIIIIIIIAIAFSVRVSLFTFFFGLISLAMLRLMS